MSVASDVEEMGISEQSGGAMGDGKDEDETPTLMSLLEVNDRKDVLEIVVQKLIGNLQYDPNREGGAVATGCTERVMKRTLFVFQEMAGGVSVIHARIGLGAGLRTTPRLVSSAALVRWNAAVSPLHAKQHVLLFDFETTRHVRSTRKKKFPWKRKRKRKRVQ